MHSALKISEAAGLALHAVALVARLGGDGPVKLSRIAGLLRASEAHLGKVMHRLAQARVVTSKRGPGGGFTLGPRAAEMTLFDVYELIDGPLGGETCLLGYLTCPVGGCVLGDAVHGTNALLRRELGDKRITELTGEERT